MAQQKFEPDTLITVVDKGYVPMYGGQRQKLKTPRHEHVCGELRTLPGSETRTIQPTAWSLYRLKYCGSYPEYSRRAVKLTTHLQLGERVRICDAIHPLPRTPWRRAQNINIWRNMQNSGQRHGLQRNMGWTRNTCHFTQHGRSELIKISLLSTVGRKSLITPFPTLLTWDRLTVLSSWRLHDSARPVPNRMFLGWGEITCSQPRNRTEYILPGYEAVHIPKFRTRLLPPSLLDPPTDFATRMPFAWQHALQRLRTAREATRHGVRSI